MCSLIEETDAPTEISNSSAVVEQWRYAHDAVGVPGIASWLSWLEMDVGKSQENLPRGEIQLNMH